MDAQDEKELQVGSVDEHGHLTHGYALNHEIGYNTFVGLQSHGPDGFGKETSNPKKGCKLTLIWQVARCKDILWSVLRSREGGRV
jgi:hypothetical protein